jgi:hypothetical protein
MLRSFDWQETLFKRPAAAALSALLSAVKILRYL